MSTDLDGRQADATEADAVETDAVEADDAVVDTAETDTTDTATAVNAADATDTADATGTDAATTVTPAAVRERLRTVIDPCSAAVGTDLDVVEMGMVNAVTVDDGAVSVELCLTSPGCMMVEYFAREVDAQIGTLDGVDSVELTTDAGFTWTRGMMSDAAREKRAERRHDLAERYEAVGTVETVDAEGEAADDD